MANGPIDDEFYWLRVSATVIQLAVPRRKVAAHDRKDNWGDLRKGWLKKNFEERKGPWANRAAPHAIVKSETRTGLSTTVTQRSESIGADAHSKKQFFARFKRLCDCGPDRAGKPEPAAPTNVSFISAAAFAVQEGWKTDRQ